MAFMRAIGGRNFLSVFNHRIRTRDVFPVNLARMSTQSTIPPPFESNQDTHHHHRQGKKSTFYLTGLGTFLACGGVGYLYKTYTDEKFAFEYQCKGIPPGFGWMIPQANCAENCCPEDECRKCEDSACLHKMDQEEEVITNANHDLENALKDVKPKMADATELALLAYCEAIELIKMFMDKGYCAMGQECLESPKFEEVWCDVYETAVKRCEKVKDALRKANCAWELICRLREIIKNGKCCKYTQCNPLLITAEQTVLCAERELLNAKALMDCVSSDSCLVEQYKDVIEDFRVDVKEEVDAFLSENPECGCNASENTKVINQAYKKVLKIHKELAQTQLTTGQVPCDQRKTMC